MSTSNLTYKDYSFANHGEVYQALEEVFIKHDITYYLVGANARDVQLYKAGIKPTRGTADIDFAGRGRWFGEAKSRWVVPILSSCVLHNPFPYFNYRMAHRAKTDFSIVAMLLISK